MGENSVRRFPENLLGNYVLEDFIRRLSRALYFRRLPKSVSNLKNMRIQKRSNGFKKEKMSEKLDKSIFIEYKKIDIQHS